jgi:hypothetical protein
MHSSRPPRGASPPAALPALLRATHLLGLALGSALGRLRESGATAARMFERAEESALLLRMMREAVGVQWELPGDSELHLWIAKIAAGGERRNRTGLDEAVAASERSRPKAQRPVALCGLRDREASRR